MSAGKVRELEPEESAIIPVAEKRAREILRDPAAWDVPLTTLLARAYIQGIRDAVNSTTVQKAFDAEDKAKEPPKGSGCGMPSHHYTCCCNGVGGDR